MVEAVNARVNRFPARTIDAGLALFVWVGIVSERFSAISEYSGYSGLRSYRPLLLEALAAAVLAGCVLVRRRTPITGYLIGSVALVVEALWLPASPLSPYANACGIYSVGRYAPQTRALWGPVILVPGVIGYFLHPGISGVLPSGVFASWLVFWGAGFARARRLERTAESRLLIRREVLAEERTRIARELHDLIGHTVNVMLVQAGAARVVLGTEPERTRQILMELEHTGRGALDELDQVLGILRQGDDSDLRPGLRQLPRLAQRLSEAGMHVVLEIDQAAQCLIPILDLSAYRIAQEALTNAFRHGRASTASVVVRCDGQHLHVEVLDNGRGPRPGYRPGRGLLGIAERAAMLAGTTEHGGGEGGGFRVRAVLPLP